nr:ABC transporter substrate-binding protein [Micromonospora sp. DSM 115978]
SSNGDCTTPGISPTEVKLGMIYPDTGALSSPFRYSRSGVDARLGLANANGGVHGRTVSYEWRDDESEPGVNGQAARLLVEQSDAFGMIMLTAAAAGSADFLAERGVPVVGIGSDGMWSEYPTMFSFANLAGAGSSVDTFGTYARAQGGTRAVFVTLDATASSDDVDGAVTASLQAQGIEIASHVTYDPSQGGEDVARAMRSAGADVLVGAVTAEIYAEVIAAVRAGGVDLKVALNPVGYTPTLLAAYGPAVAGMTIYLSYLPFEADSPAIATFHDAMARYAPELNQPNQEFAMLAYITTDLLLRGLELAGPCPTREGFV